MDYLQSSPRFGPHPLGLILVNVNTQAKVVNREHGLPVPLQRLGQLRILDRSKRCSNASIDVKNMAVHEIGRITGQKDRGSS